MAITPLPLPAPAGVVADAGAQIAGLGEVLWATKTPAELVGTVEEIQTLRSQLAALEAQVLAEVDARDLVDQRPVTLAALREVTISPEQAAVVLDATDHGTRTWDALVQLAEHALATDLPPDSHGARPRLAVTLDYDTLLDGQPPCGVTEDGLDLPAGVIRRLACDAGLIPVVLGTGSEVLDVGRRYRLVTTAIWHALVTRDNHCAFPGCTRPPIMCHAHHITHWADGGPTSLDNLVLLCGHHHRTLHNTPWQVRICSDDARPEFRAPTKPGRPADPWIRHRPRRE